MTDPKTSPADLLHAARAAFAGEPTPDEARAADERAAAEAERDVVRDAYDSEFADCSCPPPDEPLAARMRRDLAGESRPCRLHPAAQPPARASGDDLRRSVRQSMALNAPVEDFARVLGATPTSARNFDIDPPRDAA